MKLVIEGIKNMIKENKKFFLSIGVSFLIIAIGILCKWYNLSLVGILIIYIECLRVLFKRFRENIFIILFYFVIFVFILSRPTVAVLKGNKWAYFSNASINWSIVSIALTLIFLILPLFIKMAVLKKENGDKKRTLRFFKGWKKIIRRINECITNNAKTIRKVLFGILIVSFVAGVFCEIDKLMFMHGKNYEAYYSLYVSRVPSIISYTSTILFPILVIYLLMKPERKWCYLVLGAYITLQIPMLIIGERGSFVRAVIFSILYIFSTTNVKVLKQHLTLKVKVSAIIIAFLGIVLLGSYNYIRSNKEVESYNPLELFVDFFYKQGTTYDTLNKGYTYQYLIPGRRTKNYTFGLIYDSMRNNIVAQKVFNVKPLSEKNSLEMALKSNSLSHSLSYAVLGDDYLDGHGIGSSYILETYLDYGYLGIIVYSFILGCYLMIIPNLLKRIGLLSIFALCSIRYLYFVPRAEALSFVKFLFRINFWVSMLVFIMIVIIVSVFNKKKKIA